MDATPTLRDAAATLAAAFHGGLLFTWAVPRPDVRAARLPWLFEGTLRHCRRHGHVLGVGDAAAVAGWVPGDRLALTPVDLLRTGLVATPLHLGMRATLRVEQHEKPSERRLLAALTAETAYLWVLGARPDAQGTGVGARALRGALSSMAGAGYSRCLLRTDDAPNVGFYERQGFEVVEHLTDLPSGLPAWIMAAPTRPR
jgi:ribosomal protein S18 acetylase RimI-like enzyme